MEVGRLSMKYGFEPPALVTLEKQFLEKEGPHADKLLVNSSSKKTSASSSLRSSPFFGEDGRLSSDDENTIQSSKVKTSTELALRQEEAHNDSCDSVDSGLLLDDSLVNNGSKEDSKDEPARPTELQHLATSELDIKVRKEVGLLGIVSLPFP